MRLWWAAAADGVAVPGCPGSLVRKILTPDSVRQGAVASATASLLGACLALGLQYLQVYVIRLCSGSCGGHLCQTGLCGKFAARLFDYRECPWFDRLCPCVCSLALYHTQCNSGAGFAPAAVRCRPYAWELKGGRRGW